MPTRTPLPVGLTQLLVDQCGVVHRRRLVALGMSDAAIRRRVVAGVWQQVHRGVYCISTGGLSFLQRVWAGLLYSGAGAVASHSTAAVLDGLIGHTASIEVTIPEARQVRPTEGLRTATDDDC